MERIDLNTARPRDLADLPGVDRMLARRIVLDRRLYGTFRSLEDVTRVEGVSPKLLALIANHVQVQVRKLERDVPVGKLVFEHSRDPVLFSGPPHWLCGALRLRNDGEGTLPPITLGIEDTGLRTPGGAPLGRLIVGVPLRPGEHRRIMLRIQVDPTTSPGRYAGELVAGEHRHPVIFIVTEHLSTLLSPSDITLSTFARKSEHRLVVHNGGNIPLVIRDVGALVLEDPDVQCRTIRETVRHSHHHPTWDALVGTAADELKKNYANLPPLKVRTKNKPVRVDPGADAMLVLDVQVPKLPPRRNFVARILIYDAALTFELLSWLQPVDEE